MRFSVIALLAVTWAVSCGATSLKTSQLSYPFHAVASVGSSYVARLEPDGVSVLELVLSQRTRPGRNLLEPQHMWHGAEPFIFVAADFRDNAAAVTLSRPGIVRTGFSREQRLLRIADTGEALDVRVIHAQLGKKGDWEGGRLLLRLATRARTTNH